MFTSVFFLSFGVFALMAFLLGLPGIILYAAIGAGWAAWLRAEGSPWLVIEGVLWPSSIWLTYFDRSK